MQCNSLVLLDLNIKECVCIYNCHLFVMSSFSGHFDANISCQTDQRSVVDSMTCKWNKSAWAVIRFQYRYTDSHSSFAVLNVV